MACGAQEGSIGANYSQGSDIGSANQAQSARIRSAFACQMAHLAQVVDSSVLRTQVIDSKRLASEYLLKNDIFVT